MVTYCATSLAAGAILETHWNCADANQRTIADAAGAVNLLVALLASASVNVQTCAAGALRNLAWNRNGKQFAPCCDVIYMVNRAETNQARIADAGAVPPLIALLASPSVNLRGIAAEALYNLAWNGKQARPRALQWVMW